MEIVPILKREGMKSQGNIGRSAYILFSEKFWNEQVNKLLYMENTKEMSSSQ